MKEYGLLIRKRRKREREREKGGLLKPIYNLQVPIYQELKGYFYTTFLMRSFWNFPILTSFSTAVCIIVLILIPYYYFHQPFALSFTQKAVYIHHDVVKVLEAFLTACKLSTPDHQTHRRHATRTYTGI